jgi:hypothetical protein
MKLSEVNLYNLDNLDSSHELLVAYNLVHYLLFTQIQSLKHTNFDALVDRN